MLYFIIHKYLFFGLYYNCHNKFRALIQKKNKIKILKIYLGLNNVNNGILYENYKFYILKNEYELAALVLEKSTDSYYYDTRIKYYLLYNGEFEALKTFQKIKKLKYDDYKSYLSESFAQQKIKNWIFQIFSIPTSKYSH